MSDTNEEILTGEETPEEAKGKEAKKIAALYDSNIKTLVALFDNSPLLQGKNKLGGEAADALMDELFKEEQEEAGKNFKIKAKGLIKSKIAFDKFVADKTKEFNDAVTAKKKEFNKEMGETFNLLANVEKMKKDFYSNIGEGEKKQTPEGPNEPKA